MCFLKVAVAVKTLKEGSTAEVKVDFLSEADMMKRSVITRQHRAFQINLII